MMGKLSAWILKIWGWKIEGHFPKHLKKYMVPVAPHTSNWDFPIGLLLRSAQHTNIRFVIKQEWYKGPLKWLFNAIGGYPVNRKASRNFVQSIVEIFKTQEEFILNIAPEGTRKKVNNLKSGYYHIAKKANVPLVLVIFDWGNMTIRIAEPFYLTDDEKADMEFVENHFAGIRGRIPENSFRYPDKAS